MRTGDGCQFCSDGGDPTSYIPGEVMSIYIRAYDYHHKYRGLIIHANDEDDNVVGEWDVPADSNSHVHTPCSDPGVLLQTSAEEKPSLLQLNWRAPAAGTGRVYFRALIKEGPANHGYFWYPNYKGDLTLSEASDPDPNVWISGLEEESCDDACDRVNKKCTQGMLDLVDSSTEFVNLIANQITCNYPILSGCTAASPLFLSNSQCTFFDPDCEDFRKDADSSSCDATPADGHVRLCPCTSDGKVPAAFRNSARSARGSGLSWSVVLLLSMAWLLIMPSSVSAHNWMVCILS